MQCPPNNYLIQNVSSNGDLVTTNMTNSTSCIPCSTCGDREETVQPCTSVSDTVCGTCSEGQYSNNGTVKRCRNCTNCSLHNREQVSPCSASGDAICGSCYRYYFLTVDSYDRAVCKKCSPCPMNAEVVRWYDCERAGLPLDQQCAPGTHIPPNMLQNYSTFLSLILLEYMYIEVDVGA